ncbi:hypothetical protein [Celerinatantimonas diazotrophica]|uniref:Uncharacterized protein n=1 Tax=Celerinatantimonas diazotrophica TaxID=412034 RepID=A0A4R1J8K3_9GAMM|nr:hypothetical protein [Celerinatantimonas diazotrophica]TCK46376.1 hypothetical protein EV690_3652 [Celerinatantimonas diazotrophica]CAG9295250.1 hypothetical protein CEDIAZO_00362 [Celerinatantimonas diazotrophica]
MRLGRRGWNNVLIFVVLAMILIFRLTGEKLEHNSQKQAQDTQQGPQAVSGLSLLPPGATVLEIDLPDRTIQRVGTGWQSSPAASRPVVTVDAWLHVRLHEWKKPIGAGVAGQSIQIFVAHRSEPIQLTLFRKGKQYFLTNWQGKLLKLDQVTYQALFSDSP